MTDYAGEKGTGPIVSGRGSAAVLDRDEQNPLNQTKPVLETTAREAAVGGAMQDSSLTVIENPSLDLYIGILLAEHLRQDRLRTRLMNVEHIRFRYEPEVPRLRHHETVTLEKGLYSSNTYFHFVRTGEGLILPAASVIAYQICPITPAQYNGFCRSLKNLKDMKEVLLDMYRLLARNVQGFSLKRDGTLSLPPNYASLRI